MTNLIETSTWESGIYQLETTDQVLGGLTGLSNTQSKQLANRTKKIYDVLSANGIFLNTTQTFMGQNIILDAIFGNDVVSGNLVYWNGTYSKFYNAITTGVSTKQAVGIADITKGNVVIGGLIQITGIGSGKTAGQYLYLSSTTAGAIITTRTPVCVGQYLYGDIILLAKEAEESGSFYGALSTYFIDSGSANNTYVLTRGNNLPEFSSLIDGLTVEFIPTHSNADGTGVSTVTVSGLTAKNVVNPDGSAIGAYSITIGVPIKMRYNLSADKWFIVTNSNVSVNGYLGASTAMSNDIKMGFNSSLPSSYTGFYNLLFGADTYKNITTGNNNVVAGDYANTTATTSSYNVILGSFAFTLNQTGSHNVIIGYNAGRASTTANGNVIIGDHAVQVGVYTGYESTVIGYQAGNIMTSSYETVIIGANAGNALTSAIQQVLIGNYAGSLIASLGTPLTPTDSGGYTYIGHYAGGGHTGTAAGSSVGVGYKAGYYGATYDTSIGYMAGYFGTPPAGNNYGSGNCNFGYKAGNRIVGSNKSYNIHIGYRAGASTSTADYQGNIYIGANTATSSSTSGSYNIGMGYGTHALNISSYSVAIGYQAGAINYGENIAIGRQAGNNVGDNYNVMIGSYSGKLLGSVTNAISKYNVCIGYNSGYNSTYGSHNFFGGANAGYWCTDDNNTIVGSRLIAELVNKSLSVGSPAITQIAQGVTVYGNYVILTAGTSGVYSFQFDGVSTLTQKGYQNPSPNKVATTSYCDGAYIYTAWDNYIYVFSFTSSTGAIGTWTSRLTITGSAVGIYGDGTNVYVCLGSGGIGAYKMVTGNLVQQGSLYTDNTYMGATKRVFCYGSNIYVADSKGVHVFTFSGSAFTLVSSCRIATTVQSVWRDGNYVYVANGTAGVTVLTWDGVSSTMSFFASTSTIGSAQAIWGDGAYLYVAIAPISSPYNGSLQAYLLSGATNELLLQHSYNSSVSDLPACNAVWGGNGFVYVASQTTATPAVAGGLTAFKFNSSYTQTGADNVYLGFRSGEKNTGSGNVWLGAWAGVSKTGESNTLIISGKYNNVEVPLITGNFATQTINLNGAVTFNSLTLSDLNISGTSTTALTVNTNKFIVSGATGNTSCAGTFTSASTLGVTSGGANITGTLAVTGNETVSGTLNVTGLSTIVQPTFYVVEIQNTGVPSSSVPSNYPTWGDIVFNTTLLNTISGASVASNIFTLPAGTYDIEVEVPFACSRSGDAYYEGKMVFGLYYSNGNLIADINTWNCTSEQVRCASAYSSSAISRLSRRVVFASSTTIEVKQTTYTYNVGSMSFGMAIGLGVDEIYSTFKAIKVK